MENSRELLIALLKTAQREQAGIRSVLDLSMGAELRHALEAQLRELESIETEAHTLACQRGWELQDPDPALRILKDMLTRLQLRGKGSDTRIAGMMIRSNTQGMIRGLRVIHRYTGKDTAIQILWRKLLDCQTANIRQLQQFL